MRAVAILLFDNVETLDFAGPFEVFSVAGIQSHPAAFRVFTVAETAGSVTARNGLSINPRYSFDDCPSADVLIIPGGQGTRREMQNKRLIRWVESAARQAELVLSVCTGALLLGRAGLLDGLEVTTHHEALDLLRDTVPASHVLEDRRFVDNGKVVTSAGIAAGIDMSLHVVRRLLGEEVAAATAKHMEYPLPAPD